MGPKRRFYCYSVKGEYIKAVQEWCGTCLRRPFPFVAHPHKVTFPTATSVRLSLMILRAHAQYCMAVTIEPL